MTMIFALALLSLGIASASLIDLRDDAQDQQPQPLKVQHLVNVDEQLEWPFGPSIPPGVSFSRTVGSVESGSSFHLTFDSGHCSSNDDYGDNACHYDWGQTVTASYGATLSRPLDEGCTVSGTFKVDKLVDWDFTCAACGQDCVLTLPVINEERTFPARPCPIEAQSISSQTFTNVLKDTSPVDGVSTHIDGTIYVKDGDGNTLLDFSVNVKLK